MSFPYPENKILTALALALLLCGTLEAQQQGTYVNARSLMSTQASHLATNSEAVVRILSRSENKTALMWAAFAGEVSHYVLERSIDGRNYSEACVFFTSGLQEEPQYRYVDRLRNSYAGPLFYRLKVVGLDGSELYTLPSRSTAPLTTKQNIK